MFNFVTKSSEENRLLEVINQIGYIGDNSRDNVTVNSTKHEGFYNICLESQENFVTKQTPNPKLIEICNYKKGSVWNKRAGVYIYNNSPDLVFQFIYFLACNYSDRLLKFFESSLKLGKLKPVIVKVLFINKISNDKCKSVLKRILQYEKPLLAVVSTSDSKSLSDVSDSRIIHRLIKSNINNLVLMFYSGSHEANQKKSNKYYGYNYTHYIKSIEDDEFDNYLDAINKGYLIENNETRDTFIEELDSDWNWNSEYSSVNSEQLQNDEPDERGSTFSLDIDKDD